jgi:hypothetical protein
MGETHCGVRGQAGAHLEVDPWRHVQPMGNRMRQLMPEVKRVVGQAGEWRDASWSLTVVMVGWLHGRGCRAIGSPR